MDSPGAEVDAAAEVGCAATAEEATEVLDVVALDDVLESLK